MKIKILVTSLLLFFLPLSSLAGTKAYKCDKKIYNLEKQLKYAKNYGNTYRVQALERAVSNVKSNCYDHYSGATGPTRLYDHYSGATGPTRLYDNNSRERLLELELKELKEIIEELKNID